MNNHSTKLIEGTFSVASAKVLLLELISYKINFHKMKKFSNEIRYGEDLDHSEKRITELTREKEELEKWFLLLKNEDTLKITSRINIEVI